MSSIKSKKEVGKELKAIIDNNGDLKGLRSQLELMEESLRNTVIDMAAQGLDYSILGAEALLRTFRCSELGALTTHRKEFSISKLKRLMELEKRKNGEGRPLTENMEAELEKLKGERDAPDELPEGAKSYIQRAFNSLVYGMNDLVWSKEMEKGNLTESEGLELLSKSLINHGAKIKALVKNNQRRRMLDLLTGEWDTDFLGVVLDNKASWSKDTFDRAELADGYYWQLQGYSILTGARKMGLCYTLNNTPQHLIYDEFKRQCWARGIVDEESQEALKIQERLEANMTYDTLPEIERVKIFTVERSGEDVEFILSRLMMAKMYLLGLVILHMTQTQNKTVTEFLEFASN